MPRADTNLADRSGNLVDSHKGYDPRIVFFYFVIAGLFLVLAVGLAYQQLYRIGDHEENQRQQSQRRVLFPGSRGIIYDRNRVPLVTNSYRWSAVLHLDELKSELRREAVRIRDNYKDKDAKIDPKDIPSDAQRTKIARVSLVQRHLDKIGVILGRELVLDRRALEKHFEQELLLPFTLVDGLTDAEHARLVERLPVNSPVEIQPVIFRAYPFGSAAAHTLGYVRSNPDVEASGFQGTDLKTKTFKAKTGTIGKDGLEKQFDAQLQGETGWNLYRVDHAGYRINPPLEQRQPRKGQDLVTSLDIDLQLAAEDRLIGKLPGLDPTMPNIKGAAVALDVRTGEVLVLASKPDFDLNQFSPRASQKIVDQMNATGAWNNLAMNGLYAPGSTFKILTSVAGLRRDIINPDKPIGLFCSGFIMIGNHAFVCDNRNGQHGDVLLRDAISLSCDVFYYEAGRRITPTVLAEEARRFHLGTPTGVELPGEIRGTIIPDPEWKRARGDTWVPGDTANTSIGQGAVLVTPLQMACFVASIARDEVFTQPTLLHRPNAPTQRHERIGLTAEQRIALVEGMEGTVTHPRGTGRTINIPALRIPGVTIAGKTGTAQIPGDKNAAWFICFAPSRNPEIAIAVVMEGEKGDDFYGGTFAAPVASAILRKYFEKKSAAGRL
jgi:penicillin-binding protein 2